VHTNENYEGINLCRLEWNLFTTYAAKYETSAFWKQNTKQLTMAPNGGILV
jgi:hypothetical protein